MTTKRHQKRILSNKRHWLIPKSPFHHTESASLTRSTIIVTWKLWHFGRRVPLSSKPTPVQMNQGSGCQLWSSHCRHCEIWDSDDRFHPMVNGATILKEKEVVQTTLCNLWRLLCQFLCYGENIVELKPAILQLHSPKCVAVNYEFYRTLVIPQKRRASLKQRCCRHNPEHNGNRLYIMRPTAPECDGWLLGNTSSGPRCLDTVQFNGRNGQTRLPQWSSQMVLQYSVRFWIFSRLFSNKFFTKQKVFLFGDQASDVRLKTKTNLWTVEDDFYKIFSTVWCTKRRWNLEHNDRLRCPSNKRIGAHFPKKQIPALGPKVGARKIRCC